MRHATSLLFAAVIITSGYAKDYCNHPSIVPTVEKLKNNLPLQIDKATTLYNFLCLDSRYIYYITLDTKQFSKSELQASYDFDQNQANSFNKKTSGKINVRYIYHELDGSLLNIINNQ